MFRSIRMTNVASIALLALLGSVACKRSTDQAAAPEAVVGSAPAAEALIPKDRAASVTLPSMQLGSARELPGTGLEIALPKGAVRAGRTLTFEVPGRGVMFALSHSHSASTPEVAVNQAARVFKLKQEFNQTGEAWELSKAPARFAVTGDQTENMLGDRTQGLSGLIAARNETDNLFFLRASFPASERPSVEAVAASINVLPAADLDPLAVHGLKLDVLDGYVIKPGQLQPIVVLPKGAEHVSGEPLLDIRIADKGHVTELFDDVVAKFKGAPGDVRCEPEVTTHPEGPGQHYRKQTCRFESGQGPYAVRTDSIEDANGGVVAITTAPHGRGEQEGEAFAVMVSSLRLLAVPSLL